MQGLKLRALLITPIQRVPRYAFCYCIVDLLVVFLAETENKYCPFVPQQNSKIMTKTQ